jgi:hypothetical protein
MLILCFLLHKYGTFDHIVKGSMQDPNFAYLHDHDLLDREILTTIILRVKLIFTTFTISI